MQEYLFYLYKLSDEELKILNNLVSGYFNFVKIQTMRHHPMYMNDYVEHLDKMLLTTGEKLLSGASKVSHTQAPYRINEIL